MRKAIVLITVLLFVGGFSYVFAAEGDPVCPDVEEAKSTQKTIGPDKSVTQTVDINKNPEALKEAISVPQKETTERVEVASDGKIKVISQCGKEGTVGTVNVCASVAGSGEQCITISKNLDSGTIADRISGAVNASRTAVSQKGKLVDEMLKQLQSGYVPRESRDFLLRIGESQSSLCSFDPETCLDRVVGTLREKANTNEAGARELIGAIIDGDTAKVQSALKSSGVAIKVSPSDLSAFKSGIVRLTGIQPEARPSFTSALSGFCRDAGSLCTTGSTAVTQVFAGVGTFGAPVAAPFQFKSEVIHGDASTYNPLLPGWRTGGIELATGGTYNPNVPEAALQLDLAKQYGVGYGSGRIGYALVEHGDKQLIVRVNDNGPLVSGRVIDLNESAMRLLSGGQYGSNSGVLRDVRVTLLEGTHTPGLINAAGVTNGLATRIYTDTGASNGFASMIPGAAWLSGGTGLLGTGQGSGGGLLGVLGSLFGFTSTAPQSSTGSPSAPSAPTTNTPSTPTANTRNMQPRATLRCDRPIADSGSSFDISWSCSDAERAVGTGFNTKGELIGTESITLSNKKDLVEEKLEINCVALNNMRASDSCTVRINHPSIVAVANPNPLSRGESAHIGWISFGTRSCEFTDGYFALLDVQTAGGETRRGSAATIPLEETTRLTLRCETPGGNTIQSDIQIMVE